MSTTPRIHKMDEEIITNSKGGSQSKISHTPTLVPGEAMVALRRASRADKTPSHVWRTYTLDNLVEKAAECIEHLINNGGISYLEEAFLHIARAVAIEDQKEHAKHTEVPVEALLRIAEVTSLGKLKYGLNNWRKIDYTDQLDHAIAHLWHFQTGDTTDDNLGHTLCRLSFAIAMAPNDEYDFKKVTPSIALQLTETVDTSNLPNTKDSEKVSQENLSTLTIHEQSSVQNSIKNTVPKLDQEIL